MVSRVGKSVSKCPMRCCSSSNSANMSISSSVIKGKPSRKDGIRFLSLPNFAGDPSSFSYFLNGVVVCSASVTSVLAFLIGSNPKSLWRFSFFLSSSILFRSKILNPTRCSVSQRSRVLTCLSYGLELESEGATLTSRSQGLSFWSIITSKPYISKHWPLCLVERMAVVIWGSTAIRVLIQRVLMFLKTSS